MRSTDQAKAVLVVLTVVLAVVCACGVTAAPVPPGVPGVPDIGPPTAAPIGNTPAPTPATPPAVAPTAAEVAPVAPATSITPPAAPTAPASAAAPLLSAEEHYAKGEVLFAKAWVLIDDLFKDYLAARAELQSLEAEAKTGRDGIAAIQSQMGLIKNETFQAEQPVRKDMSKQMTKRRELAKDAEAPQPQQPRYQQVPLKPRQYAATVRSSSTTGTDPYQQLMDDWQRKADAITRANDALKKRYQQDLAEWKKTKDAADKELPNVDQAIKGLQGKLDQSAAALTTKQAPLLEKVKLANEEAQALARKIEAVQTRLRGLTDALKAAPETLRFKHGILEWEGAFWPLADLEKQLNETQAEIDRVCVQMKAEEKAAGRPLPDNWRHPQQDRMDALKALITRAKAVAR